MNGKKLKLLILPKTLAICRLEKDAAIPEWAMGGSFVSITRTEEELSIACSQGQVPAEIKKEGGWRCIKVKGPLDFSLTGILASLTLPLAQEGHALTGLEASSAMRAIAQRTPGNILADAIEVIPHEQRLGGGGKIVQLARRQAFTGRAAFEMSNVARVRAGHRKNGATSSRRRRQ